MFREKIKKGKNTRHKSDLFKETLKRFHNECVICKSKSNLVLHRIISLQIIGDENKKNSTILCKDCQDELKRLRVEDPDTFWRRIVFRGTVEY